MSETSDGVPKETSDPRRARIRAVIDDFFADKPPGTTIEQADLEAYWARLRDAAKEAP